MTQAVPELGTHDVGHRLRDLDLPERVFEVRAAGLAHEFPPLRSLEVHLTNLLVQLTSFVGREGELVEIGRLLTDHRVVTLVGVGGTGTTRVMLQALRADMAGCAPQIIAARA